MSKYLSIVMMGVIVLCMPVIGCSDDDDDTSGKPGSDADSDTDSDSDSDADSDTDSDADSASESDTDWNPDTDSNSDDWESCPQGNVQYTSKSGETFCCPGKSSVFCDEKGGYAGGCWSEGTDCKTLIFCENDWKLCKKDAVSYCNDKDEFSCWTCPNDYTMHFLSKGEPTCCAPHLPQFCGDTNEGYEGGCWEENTDCNSVTFCQGRWRGCLAKERASCFDNIFDCS